MRGYFGIGIEGVSKAMNVGSLLRSAHAFGAAFVFTVAADYRRRKGEKADTSHGEDHVPFYSFPDAESMILPRAAVSSASKSPTTPSTSPAFTTRPRRLTFWGRNAARCRRGCSGAAIMW
jgi:hypothetical protein